MNGPFGTQQFISEKKKESIKALDAILLTVFQSYIYESELSEDWEIFKFNPPNTAVKDIKKTKNSSWCRLTISDKDTYFYPDIFTSLNLL